MNQETIVAVFDTPAHAALAAGDLRAFGVPDSAISLHAAGGVTVGPTIAVERPARAADFWSELFGGEPDHDTTVYERSIERGSTVVTVRAPEEDVAEITEILDSHQPIDLDERATEYGLRRPERTMQLAEEQLVVGKRVVSRGSTRVRRFVVVTPVERQIVLRSETVTVDRRPPSDGRVVEADAFSGRTVEMTASAEEAVVSKTVRVVEEIAIGTEVSERVETVRDTVRKEEVEIERVPAKGSGMTE